MPYGRACALRLDARGLSADGAPITLDAAVARCRGAGRADVSVSLDAPASALAELTAALARVGVPVAAARNARRNTSAVGAPAQVSLDDFARTVHEVARHIEPDAGPTGMARGRFGTRKVFIAAILRALVGTRYGELAPRAIDALLLRAHRAGLLQLARADLVAAMEPGEVRASEVVDPHVGATFHFVISERGPDE